ncbi:hypothetical protein ACFFU8_18215 [Chromobacterium piscinae]|uniref:hypothetical protein n=1 Tax=Chromobacterium piscinae TaxID=686831 RepID=UPI001E2FE10B|nr:hypothetical protein [Chromobacterium piscinae]MCD5326748.1 hypothetical protein [Chromobacterium piscinae]
MPKLKYSWPRLFHWIGYSVLPSLFGFFIIFITAMLTNIRVDFFNLLGRGELMLLTTAIVTEAMGGFMKAKKRSPQISVLSWAALFACIISASEFAVISITSNNILGIHVTSTINKEFSIGLSICTLSVGLIIVGVFKSIDDLE